MKYIGIFLLIIGASWLIVTQFMREPVIGEIERHMSHELATNDCFTRQDVADKLQEYRNQVWKTLPSIKIPCILLLAGMFLYLRSVTIDASRHGAAVQTSRNEERH